MQDDSVGEQAQSPNNNPRIFISYSWDTPEHKLWVQSLAGELRKVGVDARLDEWRDEDQSIDSFMMVEVERADAILAICTPEYKRKILQDAEGGATASGVEISAASALRRHSGKPIIPLLRSGTWEESAPSTISSYRYYDFSDGTDASSSFSALKDRLLGHTKQAPDLGPRSGPTEAPELPDIFAGADKGSTSPVETPEQPTPPPKPKETSERETPVKPQPADQSQVTDTPAGTGGKGKYIGAAAVLVLAIVIFSTLTGEDAALEPVVSTGTEVMDDMEEFSEQIVETATDDFWLDEVDGRLRETLEMHGYSGSPIFEQPEVGSLAQGEEIKFSLSIDEALSSSVVAVCDKNCANLNMALYEDGIQILTVNSEYNFNALDLSDYSGDYEISLRMGRCGSESCSWAYQVYSGE